MRIALAQAHEIGMGPECPQPRIVGGDDGIALGDHVGDAGNAVDQIVAQRGGAFDRDPGRRVSPGDDWASAGRNRELRDDDGTRHRNRLAFEPGRTIEDAKGADPIGGVQFPRLNADDAARRPGELFRRHRIERLDVILRRAWQYRRRKRRGEGEEQNSNTTMHVSRPADLH